MEKYWSNFRAMILRFSKEVFKDENLLRTEKNF